MTTKRTPRSGTSTTASAGGAQRTEAQRAAGKRAAAKRAEARLAAAKEAEARRAAKAAEADRAGASEEEGGIDLENLVGSWLTVPDIAERFSVSLATVRRMLADREVVGARVGERRVVAVPERFFDEHGPRHDLRGTITVLADGGMNDPEIIAWLFTPDPTLRVPGSPMDNLWAGHKTEIRRRAQEHAF